MDVLQPLAWLGISILALFAVYLGARVVFRAWFKSRLEYYQEYQKRRKQHESDTKRNG